MFKKITIDGKELEFAANAATPFCITAMDRMRYGHGPNLV